MEVEIVSETQDECVHHWLIESPKGEASLGVCKLCGARRDFFNSPETKFLRLSRDTRTKPPTPQTATPQSSS